MNDQPRVIEIGARDLPLHCPTTETVLWCSHPRVFLEVSAQGEALCPYCGTRYRLKEGEHPPQH